MRLLTSPTSTWRTYCNRAVTGWEVLRHLGIGWGAYRALHLVQHRTGHIQRQTPKRRWEEIELPQPGGQPFEVNWLADPPPFLFPASALESSQNQLVQWDAGKALRTLNQLKENQWTVFGAVHPGASVGQWHEHPRHAGASATRYEHWTETSAFAGGDIKWLWEPARLGVAFTMSRAYAQTGSETFAKQFWELADSFWEQNPPNQGVHWMCGQEVALRLMAFCFGAYATRCSPSATPQRIRRLAKYAQAAAERVEAHIGYALSQKNNHGVSEAAGLLTVAWLFPQLQHTEQRRRRGHHLLDQLATELIYDDGAFSQHSANYQRLMLQVLLWCIRLGDMNGDPVTPNVRQRAAAAAEFLWNLQDEQTGQLPNYGENDGALAFPMSPCDFRDYRPVLQAAALILEQTPRYAAGPWDEETFWWTGQTPTAATPTTATSTTANAAHPTKPQHKPQHRPCDRVELRGGPGGCHTLRAPGSMGGTNFAMIRCTLRYRHRPVHADSLHVDLWWRGQNIALDPGTYSYNAPPPWNHPLASAKYHNSVTVDDVEPMRRVSRFLFTRWTRATVNRRWASEDGRLGLWEGAHDGYRQQGRRLKDANSVGHRRAVLRVGEDHWIVIDDLRSRGLHNYRLHWLLACLPHTIKTNHICLTTQQGDYQFAARSVAATSNNVAFNAHRMSTESAASDSPAGWHCPMYGQRQPALATSCDVQAHSVQFVSCFGPQLNSIECDLAGGEGRGGAGTGAGSIQPTGVNWHVQCGRECVEFTLPTLTGKPSRQLDQLPLLQSLQWHSSQDDSQANSSEIRRMAS